MKESIERHISFAGCGFIGIYHVGVSAFLKKYSSHLLNTKIGGSSAGAMCALALVSGDISLEISLDSYPKELPQIATTKSSHYELPQRTHTKSSHKEIPQRVSLDRSHREHPQRPLNFKRKW